MVFFAFCFGVVVVLFIYDTAKFPVCPMCGDNLNTKRGKILSPLAQCKVHGEIIA